MVGRARIVCIVLALLPGFSARAQDAPAADSLAVFGAIDMTGDSDVLEIVLDGHKERIRGGRYVLATATEGVFGTPKTIIAPLRVKVTFEANRILADVPGAGTVIVVR